MGDVVMAAYGFLRPHIAGTSEKVTMMIAVADVSYDPDGATPLLVIAKKDGTAAQFSVSGELVQASGVRHRRHNPSD